MIPIEKNKEYTVTVDAVSSDGNGIAHIDGFAVFIPRTVDGDEVKILVVKVKSRFAYGKLLEIITPSNKRAEVTCSAYKRCGGCQLRHIKYDSQLEIKKDIVENAMQRIGNFENFEVEKIVGMDKPERYRNKMVFPIGFVNGKTECGFYAQRSHDIIPLKDCLIGDKLNSEINKAVITYMNDNNIPPYDEINHRGVVRRVFTRTSRSTGEVMVVISANVTTLPKSEKLVNMLRTTSDRISSIILNINTKRNNLVITDNNVTLWGKNCILDTLCGIEFEISPESFFQVNPIQTEKLYNTALEYAGLNKNTSVMDIYCGIGTISLCAATKAKNVIGIEIVERAIEDAKENAKRNNINNAVFYADSAENIVPLLIEKGEKPDVVILDPPRKGSDEKTLSAIIKAQPQRIVYVSCNPATLARDARFLADRGYFISKSSAFDLFPHTTHVETVALLSKLNTKQHIEVKLNMDELDLTSAESKATYEEIKAYVLEHTGLKVSHLNIAQTKRKYGIIERENYNKPKSENAKQPQCTPEKETAIVDTLKYYGMI